MPFSDLRAAQGPLTDRGLGFHELNPLVAAERREVIRAIHTVNAAGATEPSSELRFAIEAGTGQTLIQLVDRVTNEVIEQVPPETLLRTAEALRELQDGRDNDAG